MGVNAAITRVQAQRRSRPARPHFGWPTAEPGAGPMNDRMAQHWRSAPDPTFIALTWGAAGARTREVNGVTGEMGGDAAISKTRGGSVTGEV